MINKLTEIDNNIDFRIVEFRLDFESKRRLNNMGICRDDLYERQAGRGNGPIIIRNISTNSTPIAISKDLADGIIARIGI
jgi:Fe2+ transport system protein FeoA